MAYLMRQSQLWYLGRYSAVVIHESYDTGVQGSLSGLIQAGHRFGISLELLANTTGRAWRGCNPSESKGASGEVPVDKAWNNVWEPVTVNRHGVIRSIIRSPVSEDIGETEVLVIRKGMQVQEVTDVDVLQAERIWVAVWRLKRTRRLVIDLISDIVNVSHTRECSPGDWYYFRHAILLPLFVEPQTWCSYALSFHRTSCPCRCNSRRWRGERSRTIFPL